MGVLVNKIQIIIICSPSTKRPQRSPKELRRASPMANAPRTRQRVTAPRRAPDGSAFIKCDRCGILVVVALLDMHECDGMKARLKKSMGGKVGLGVRKTSLVVKSGLKKKRSGIGVVGIQDQPRSAFRCFMESFKKTCKADNWMEIDMEGFNTWKNMSREERGQYVIEAEKVNSAYDKILQEEMEDMSEVDDEADSCLVGKFDVRYVKPMDYLSSSHWGLDKGYDDFDSSGWYSDSENTFLPNFGSEWNKYSISP